MMPALLYARARNPMQISDQLHQLHAYAESNGYAVLGAEVDSTGGGGPGFIKLLARAVRLGEAVTVIVTEPSRLTRDLGVFDFMMLVLKKCRVQTRFVAEAA
jgi:DNA invertase Pin-like site-specific DNA recombinase